MNRKDFQLWLDQFPEDTEIQVGLQQDAPSYCPYGAVYFEKFKGEKYDDYEYFTVGNGSVLRLGDAR